MRQRQGWAGRVIVVLTLVLAVGTQALAQRTEESVEKGRRKVVRYDERGTLLEVGEQVDEKDLPAPVAAAMHSHRRAIFVSGMKFTRGKDVRYELTLRGSRKTAMVAKADGTVVTFK
jgi:negative regulator of replication initiation